MKNCLNVFVKRRPLNINFSVKCRLAISCDIFIVMFCLVDLVLVPLNPETWTRPRAGLGVVNYSMILILKVNLLSPGDELNIQLAKKYKEI